MNIEKLEDIKDDFLNNELGHPEEDMLDIGLFMQYTIDLLKDIITDLQQTKTYYLNEDELSREKIGGTD